MRELLDKLISDEWFGISNEIEIAKYKGVVEMGS